MGFWFLKMKTGGYHESYIGQDRKNERSHLKSFQIINS
jgi:hypothetical protein